MAVLFGNVLIDIAVAVATFSVAVYLFFANAFGYWKKRGVHYVKPSSFTGNLGTVFLQKEHLACYLKKVYDSNPTHPVVGLFAFRNPLLMISDLDLIKNVLVKDAQVFLDRSSSPSEKSDPLAAKSLFFLKGNRWRHMRVKLTPTFTSGKIKNMFYLINECCEQLVFCIQREMSKGDGVWVKDTIARYSTDVIASCAFGVNVNALADPSCEFRATTRKIFERSKLQKFYRLLSTFAPWVIKLLRLKIFDESINVFLRKTFWDVADYRKKSGTIRKDFVDILMQMKEEGHVRAEDANDVEEIKQDSKYMGVEKTRSDKADIKLEADDFVAQAFIFIAAGFETASSVISFTLMELALQTAIQDKLRSEIKSVLKKHNSKVTYDAIADMNYLEMVVSEALRKHPTVPVLERKCSSDYKIAGTNITIEKGTNIVIPVLAIHNDPNLYPDPETFDPERFSAENKNKRPNFAHLPFGEGPRICIGMRFGQMQVKTALVHILTNFKVTTCASSPKPPIGITPGGTVNIPRKNIILAFHKI